MENELYSEAAIAISHSSCMLKAASAVGRYSRRQKKYCNWRVATRPGRSAGDFPIERGPLAIQGPVRVWDQRQGKLPFPVTAMRLRLRGLCEMPVQPHAHHLSH